MGVKGLWSLLNPVARPVQIESLEGKRLAIDSSIWLYQFQATMRDKDGRVLVNAHVLGFLRRINKLLFHGIKPVFVFDGGAPALKRATIAERRRRKAGAALNHAKTAEKLFAAQMRREAVKVTQAHREAQASRDEATAATAASTSRYDREEGDQIAENAVYLEDLEGRPGLQPQTATDASSHSHQQAAPAVEPPDPAEERRKRFRKHDPYRLPEAQMPKVSTDEKPDARLATEAELKQFIDEVHPGDIDVESAEFRALPTEVQYEIIGDLRIRSRQQSHKRLADMLRAAPTALDFSRAQIKHLSQRNALTQQLLEVTDMVGHAHLTIPVRIAAERNREYVLVKRGESEGGGWALGIREGTKANPIRVMTEAPREQESDSESGSYVDEDEEDEEQEEGEEEEEDVKVVSPPVPPPMDPDLLEHRRREVLEAIAARYAPKQSSTRNFKGNFRSHGKGASVKPLDDAEVQPTANDEALALALQQEELGEEETEADPELSRALALSRQEKELADRHGQDEGVEIEESSEREEEEISEIEEVHHSDDSMEEVSLVPSEQTTPMTLSRQHSDEDLAETFKSERDEDEDFEIMKVDKRLPDKKPDSTKDQVKSQRALDRVDAALARTDGEVKVQSRVTQIPDVPPPLTPEGRAQPTASVPSHFPAPSGQLSSVGDAVTTGIVASESSAHSSAENVTSGEHAAVPISLEPLGSTRNAQLLFPNSEISIPTPSTKPAKQKPRNTSPDIDYDDHLPDEIREPHRLTVDPFLAYAHRDEDTDSLHDLHPSMSRSPSRSSLEQSEEPSGAATEDESEFEQEDEENEDEEDDEDDDEQEGSLRWSKSPSPVARKRPQLQTEQSGETIPSEGEDEGEGMAPADMVAEEDDYARFLASIKNRDLNEVRTEIDDEIRVLNAANKVAMRDSDEISQAMIAQIQTLLRHFGIPYITAPMEAEAQCAKLAELGLVDGIITDDSDVFLFGGIQCFKNIFNDAKYAECFLLADIGRELSLTRERLISLAYLLGSDYTIGLPGVGPVVALELLANFPGPQGVDNFKAWWMKVQRGQDNPWESDTKWKQSFKKRFSSLIYLTTDWPNPLVREAYKYPDTDNSEEPFHWGFPKLSALRAFLHEELSWSISKVDDELTPIVQRIARRGKAGALNVQATLDPFFDLSVVSGNYAPRRRTTANVSKRLMTVIKDFREAEARITGSTVEGWGDMMADLDGDNPQGRAYARKGPNKQIRRTASGSKDDVLKPEEEGEKSAPKARRKPVKRKRTSSDLPKADPEEPENVSEKAESEEPLEEVLEEAEEGEATQPKRTKPKQRPKNRGTRRWIGPRWDVIEKPEQ